MNRIATVLYPADARSGPDASPTSGEHGSAHAGAHAAARDGSPARAPFPLSIAVPAAAKSIYDDPRAVRFPSPPPLLHADSATPHASPGGTLGLPLRRPSRPGSNDRSSASRASLASQTSSSTSGATLTAPTPIPDRSLRTNLMQHAAPKSGSKRAGTPAPNAAGRLTSMAKGPPSRFVVGGGQYLRVLQITDPEGSIPLAAQATPRKVSGRQPGPPFAKGPGGTTLSEVVNLWKGSWSIGKGVNAVDWATGNFDNKVLTATPSGSFMIFDVNRGKLDREVSGGHPRPMNAIKACKSTGQGHLILTGGTEGQARLWDLRDSEPVNRKYYKHNAPVTALEFCPDDHHQFVVGTEAGGLFRYDYRVPAKAIGKVWGAHGSKAVLDLKWKVGGEDWDQVGQGWMASAGVDRTVQIWDMALAWEKGSAPVHTLHTAYPIRYVDWRPVHPTELLVVPFDQTSNPAYDPSRPEPSDPVMLDPGEAALEVWDVRRHYVSKFALSGCDDVPVAAIWDDEDSLVACYQKGTLIQIDLQSRVVPKTLSLETIPRQVVSWSGKGELAYAIDRFKMGEIPFDDVKPEFASHWQIGHGGTRGKSIADPGYEPAQTTGVLPLPDGDDAEFEYMAHHYRLEGDGALALCRWNREVAEVCGRMDEAQAWDLLSGLIDEFAPAPDGLFNEGIFSQTDPFSAAPLTSPTLLPDGNHARQLNADAAAIPLRPTADSAVAEEPASDGSAASLSGSDFEDEAGAPAPAPPPRRQRFRSFAPPAVDVLRPSALRHVSTATAMARGSSSGGVSGRQAHKRLQIESPTDDTPTPGADMDYPDPYGIAAALESLNNSTPGLGPPEPLARGRMTSRSTPHSTRPPSPSRLAMSVANSYAANGGPPSAPVTASQRPSDASAPQERLQPGAITRSSQNAYSQEQWDAYRAQRCAALLDWWAAFINDGEVQVAAALFVVGAEVIDFPRKQTLRVLESYLDLLERYRLTVPMAYVRRFAGIVEMQTVAAIEGITQVQHCAKCGRSTGSLEDAPGSRPFWWCRRCKQRSKTCAVCREPVRGLWMSCRRCKHGGHQRCMRLYYMATEKPAASPAPATPRTGSPMPSPGHAHAGRGAHAHVSASASHDSGLTERSVGVREDGSEATDGTETGLRRNVCPTGCGCQCRAVGEYGHE